MLELKNVTYKNILHIENLAFGQAPLTLVHGPSGGGKTTLLRLLCNILPCDGGEIYLNGKNVLEHDPIEYRRTVTMLSQNIYIIDKTIQDNIAYICHIYGKKPPQDDEIHKALELVMLRKHPSDDVYSLSGGEKQRLALCRALFLNPQILILDEPASALDVETATEVLDRFLNFVNNKGIHVILVSHAEETVKREADKILVSGGTAIREAP